MTRALITDDFTPSGARGRRSYRTNLVRGGCSADASLSLGIK
jgi:hypothetical protein